MSNGFQALKFVMLDFGEHWDRTMLVTGYANIQYTALKKTKLAVVTETSSGGLVTYRFAVEANEVVFVVDQVVHVPSRCAKQEKGNSITCGAQVKRGQVRISVASHHD